MNENPKKAGRPASATLREARPDLADQLVHPELGDVLAKGSNDMVEWRCELGHVWSARVFNRTNAKNLNGCPYCSNRKVLPGFNDLATMAPEVAALCTDPADAHRYAKFSNKKISFTCDNNPAHVWEAPIARLTQQGSRCPYCSGRVAVADENSIAVTHPEIVPYLADPSLATRLKEHSNKIIEWRCIVNPEHTWSVIVSGQLSKQQPCSYCSGYLVDPGVNDFGTTHPELAATLCNPELARTLSKGSDVVLEWICPKKPHHTWTSTIANRIQGGCPFCANRKIIVGENDLATTHPELAAQMVNPELATTVTDGGHTVAIWQCSQNPAHTWKTPIYHRTVGGGTGCPYCSNSVSRGENNLIDVVRQLLGPDAEIRQSDRKVLGGRNELDIVIPSRKIAIEFNGIYWHSEVLKSDNLYHRKKTQATEAAGYQLLHIWEDDWYEHREALIQTLAYKLQATTNLPQVLSNFDPADMERVYARQLDVIVPASAQAAAFLDQHHIQGAVSASRHLSLVDTAGDIHALMSLRSPQHNARMKRKAGEWEIQRYAVKGRVPGGFTKLMKHAEQMLRADGEELTQWISFSSNDISNGGLYASTGFVLDAELPPDYKYVGNSTGWKRESKQRYQRARFRDNPKLLWDESWTEHEAALRNNLYRIYDAGKKRWVKSVVM